MRRRGEGRLWCDLKEGSPSPPLTPPVMSVSVCVCALPKGGSLSSSLHCPSFSALATQLDRELLVLCVTVRCSGIGAHARQR